VAGVDLAAAAGAGLARLGATAAVEAGAGEADAVAANYVAQLEARLGVSGSGVTVVPTGLGNTAGGIYAETGSLGALVP
jgi:hypothetical protein